MLSIYKCFFNFVPLVVILIRKKYLPNPVFPTAPKSSASFNMLSFSSLYFRIKSSKPFAFIISKGCINQTSTSRLDNRFLIEIAELRNIAGRFAKSSPTLSAFSLISVQSASKRITIFLQPHF